MNRPSVTRSFRHGYIAFAWDNLSIEECKAIENADGDIEAFWNGWNAAFNGEPNLADDPLVDAVRGCFNALARGESEVGVWFWPTEDMINHYTTKVF